MSSIIGKPMTILEEFINYKRRIASIFDDQYTDYDGISGDELHNLLAELVDMFNSYSGTLEQYPIEYLRFLMEFIDGITNEISVAISKIERPE